MPVFLGSAQAILTIYETLVMGNLREVNVSLQLGQYKMVETARRRIGVV